MLVELVKHPKIISQIRARRPIWKEALLAVTRGLGRNAAVVYQLLLAGIDYQHLTTEIHDLATIQKHRSLLELVDRQVAEDMWLQRAMDMETDTIGVAI